MGKRNNIVHECIKSLKKQERYGESKYEAKKIAKAKAEERGEAFKNVQGIYSYNTMNTYIKNCKHFINYCMKEYKSKIKHYSDCRKYMNEYLQTEIDRGLSAWTIHTKASAICSSYGIRLEELEISLPSRNREDITRTRGYDTSKYKSMDERFNDMKTFIKATGCRRSELLALRKQDIRFSENGKYCFIYKRGKGGVERWSIVNPKHNNLVKEMFERQPVHRVNGEERIFKNSEIPHSAIHDLRADYAVDIYNLYKSHSKGSTDRYYCRNERAGDSFDREILKKVSYNMGHHREDVVVNNYLYGMHGGN